MNVLNFEDHQYSDSLTNFSIRLITSYKCPLFIYHSVCDEFTWYTLHKPVVSQLRTEDTQSQCRSPRHGRTVLHFDLQCLLAQSQGFDQHIHTCCDSVYSEQPSGSHCTLVSRREGRWSLQVWSTLSPWWKHSTLHKAHCGPEVLRAVHLMSHTRCHIVNHMIQI